MIALPVSEAEAFDYYSILEVKRDHGLPVKNQLRVVMKALCKSCEPLVPILESPEYASLYNANLAVFDAIELAHRDGIKASEVQQVNHQRFIAKRALQERFWPTRPLMEVKTLCAAEVKESCSS